MPCMEEVLCNILLYILASAMNSQVVLHSLYYFKAPVLSFAKHRFFFSLNGFKMWTNQRSKIPFPFSQLVEQKLKE